MKVAMIVAVAENNAIGLNNKMPWHLPEDLQHFKAITMGKPIIMGRKTFESLRKPLPGRTNIVITRDATYDHDGIRVVHSLTSALSLAKNIAMADTINELMVIGGANIYQQALPLAQRLYLTRIHKKFEGDTFFPELDNNQWQEMTREDKSIDSTPPLNYSHIVMERQPNGS